jgi:hypothetical protein
VVAATAPPKPVKTAALTAQASDALSGAGIAALSNSLLAKGVDSSLSARALFAYQQSQGLAAPLPTGSLLAAN